MPSTKFSKRILKISRRRKVRESIEFELSKKSRLDGRLEGLVLDFLKPDQVDRNESTRLFLERSEEYIEDHITTYHNKYPNIESSQLQELIRIAFIQTSRDYLNSKDSFNKSIRKRIDKYIHELIKEDNESRQQIYDFYDSFDDSELKIAYLRGLKKMEFSVIKSFLGLTLDEVMKNYFSISNKSDDFCDDNGLNPRNPILKDTINRVVQTRFNGSVKIFDKEEAFYFHVSEYDETNLQVAYLTYINRASSIEASKELKLPLEDVNDIQYIIDRSRLRFHKENNINIHTNFYIKAIERVYKERNNH